MTEAISEGKTFGFEKPKTKVHLVAFRLDDKHWQTLQSLFELLNIQPRKDRITNKMLMLIDRVEGLHEKVIQAEKDKETLKRKIKLLKKEKLTIEKETRFKLRKNILVADIQKSKGKPIPKQRPKTYEHSIAFTTNSKPHLRPEVVAMQKVKLPIKTTKEDDWVVCPDVDNWVRKSVECKKCGQENFKKFSECFKERVKHPFSPIFKCSKPKPNL